MMKTKIITILVTTMLVGVGEVRATDITFTSDGQINPGEVWSSVSIYNDGTVVDMLGGFVEQMDTYDYSMVNITAGSINSLCARNYSITNFSGGSIYGPTAFDYATVNLSGDASAVSLGIDDFGTLNMNGGSIGQIGIRDSGTVNLYGGIISERLLVLDSALESAVINVFGYNLDKTSSGGHYGYGQVYGFWQDGTAFTIELDMSKTYSHVNLIPEPSSILLFVLGAVLLRKRKSL
ncbi:MAG TPA: PEP-CTERM sorting domain-containing protein [Planctomycetes bacterium]|nr:PEP-CTERM sorting domain-containing protein [Planctomycetota bacterium]